MKKLRKALVVSVMAITVLSLSVLSVPLQADAAAQAGDLIKMDGLSSVYYLAADGKRYVFPNEATYFSWYGDFSGVVVIPQSELESYSLGANVTIRPGTKLIKITTDPKVYAVEPNGNLVHVPDEATAITLYGADWAGRVVDIADAFFTNYNVTGNQVSDTAYPTGSLVQFGGSADVSYIDATGNARKVADEASFLANRFKWADIIVSTLTAPTAGTDVTGSEEGLTDTSSGAGGTAGAGTGLTVALASDTPASQNIPKDISVEMLRFNLTAANDGDVSVSTLTLSAGGLGDGGDVEEVSLFVNGVKYGNSKDISSSDYTATFNLATPIVVDAGVTKTVVVKAQVSDVDMYNLYIASASDVVTDGASVSGSFPVTGNTMSGVDATVGKLTFDGDDNDDTAQVGENEVSAATFTVVADNEDVYLSGLTLKNDGNLDDIDTGVFTLLMNDDEIATAEMVGDYVSFVFDEILMEDDSSEDFEVLVDIEGGSAGEKLTLYLDDDADVSGVGKKGYPVEVVKTAFDKDDGDCTEITMTAGDLVINFDDSAISAKDVLADTNDVVLGRLEITANAEAVTIEDIAFTITGNAITADDLEGFEMIGVNGTSGSYDLTNDNSATVTVDGEYQLSSDEEIYIVKGGTITFDIRVDVMSTADTDDTYRVELAKADITAEGQESEETISDITPSSVDSQYATVVESGLSHSILSLGDVTAIAGNDTAVKAYKGRFTAATAADVKVTKVIFEDNDDDAGTDFNEDDVSLVTFVVYNEVGDELSSEDETSITANGNDDNYVTFGDDFIVPAGEYVNFYLMVKFSSSAAANDAFKIRVKEVTAKNSGENTDTVTVTPATGYGTAPTVTLAENGYMDITMSITETEANSDMYVTAGKTSGLMATLKFDAQDEDIVIEDFVLVATENDVDIYDDILSVQLIDSDGTTVLDETNSFSVGDYTLMGNHATGTDDVFYTFEDWNYTIEEVGVKEIYIKVVTNEIGTGEQVGTASTTIEFSIYDVKAIGSNGELTITGTSTPVSTDTTSNWDYDATTKDAINAGITVTGIVNDISDTSLTGGENIIGEFKFAFDSGNNTDSDGNPAEFNLVSVDLTIGEDVTGLGGIEVYWESDVNTKVSVASSTIDSAGTYTVTLTSLAGVASEDVLVVKAVDVSGYTDHYIQTKLLDVDTTIVWDDGTGSGINLTGVLLDYVDITCTSVSN